ncbi:DNA mismatch repair endonuclease MutL [Anaerolentibacter hominis]|uniref:DNA mismatch repair endonuclease MutL n=1 Tax=Anaerolentibacter hominis TaxID=3079009 RepID=UPI0031B83466
MREIELLDEATVNKIAAGEVIERPSAVVKELVENAVDAGATMVTVEIKEGGISFIRVTDNGSGIPKDEIPKAFLRHATSKIRTAADLTGVKSLGFRGEALSSIAAVGMVEVITKTRESLTGIRYLIDGGKEKGLDEIGCPEGTTFLVRNLFFNTPARKKFLKTPVTEGSYIGELMERAALSHPEISFKFMNNNQLKLHTTGNDDLQSIIYHIYGRETAKNILPVHVEGEGITIDGFVGKPVVSRGNRGFENYFVNGRYVRSNIISKAIEEAFRPYLMNHRYPFSALHFTVDGAIVDVNVHPTKQEVRFDDNVKLYDLVYQGLKEILAGKEYIVDAGEDQPEKKAPIREEHVEPFETRRERNFVAERKPDYHAAPRKEERKTDLRLPDPEQLKPIADTEIGRVYMAANGLHTDDRKVPETPAPQKTEQIGLFEEKLLSKKARDRFQIIGQLFATYWLVQYEDNLFIIDQHAAHEKILYEKAVQRQKNKEYASQLLAPPVLLSLSMREEEVLARYRKMLTGMGFEIESFGGREYQIRAIPADMLGLNSTDILTELIDTLAEGDGTKPETPESVLAKLAALSCKAAVKGNQTLSYTEAFALIDELLELENPYHCPHGRPVIISMSKYELEKKFKRII